MTTCPTCNKAQPEGTTFCGECGARMPAVVSLSTGETNAATVKALEQPASLRREELPLANVGRRIIAGAIDVTVAVSLLWVVYRYPILGRAATWAIVPYLLPCLYILFKDAVRGQSLGKLIAGLITVHMGEMKPAGFADSIIRNWFLAIIIVPPRIAIINLGLFLFAFLAFLIFLQIMFKQKHRMGDRWAQTQVVNRELWTAAG